jgi:carbon starvation protein
MEGILYQEIAGRLVLHAMPVLLAVLAIFAIAYRYYSAFLAAKVAVLDDRNPTPAHRLYDGQNYHPTSRWVLFGVQFAAISGAGPLIGPVLAMQFGYLPGLLWLVIGVCLAGAVQDMLVLAASVRRGGKSLAEIARTELGPWATVVVSAAILFIVVIALAGLGMVVVKALGGEEVPLSAGMQIRLPENAELVQESANGDALRYRFPENCALRYTPQDPWRTRPESFLLRVPGDQPLAVENGLITLPAGCRQIVLGSSWGTFTIACTIPIALLVGFWMYRLRPGKVVEASLVGAVGVIAATILGNWIPGSPLEPYFSLTREQTILAMCIYGFIASVLPVWLLLAPRDYLSSFLKIGTILLLVVGVVVANPPLRHPPINEVFLAGGPTFKGSVFPFVFICIMCGAISGFHSLVSSGTTPKMVDKESDIRLVGYGAMLMEGLVGVVALIAAASLDPKLYFDMNTDLSEVAQYQQQLDELYRRLSQSREAKDPLHQAGVQDLHQLAVPTHDLAEVERMVGGEALRGRTGGAVTLAVGMALIFTDALRWTGLAIEQVMKYWYHFAIMFEALFILTTIDTGTRIARFLLQEALGKVYRPFERTDWLPGAVLATAVVTTAWGALIWTGSISTIWPMFGIANQLLAVVALALVTTLLINSGRGRYAWVTLLPMLFVISTTMTAGVQMITRQFPAMIAQGGSRALAGYLNIGLTLFVMLCVVVLLLNAVVRWVTVWLTAPATLVQKASAPAPADLFRESDG